MKSNYQNYLIKVLLIIYLILFSYSTFSYFRSYKNLRYSYKKDIEKTKADLEKAVNLNYLPYLSPKYLKEYFKNSGIYPIGFIPHSKVFYCNEGYGLIKFKTDRFGLRNRNNKWDNVLQKNNIFIIGDSFVDGACVSERHLLSNSIQNKIGINTINLGFNQNTPYEYINILSKLLPKILTSSEKSNTVILTFYTNDNIKVDKDSKELILRSKGIVKISSRGEVSPRKSYLNLHREIIQNNFSFAKEDLNKKIERFKTNWKRTFAYQAITLVPVRILLKGIIWKEEKNSPSKEAISKLKEICNTNCKPVVVYIPNSSIWSPDRRAKKYKYSLKKASLKNNIMFLDGEKVINRKKLDDYAITGGHLSISGYKKLSDFISNEIFKKDTGIEK